MLYSFRILLKLLLLDIEGTCVHFITYLGLVFNTIDVASKACKCKGSFTALFWILFSLSTLRMWTGSQDAWCLPSMTIALHSCLNLLGQVQADQDQEVVNASLRGVVGCFSLEKKSAVHLFLKKPAQHPEDLNNYWLVWNAVHSWAMWWLNKSSVSWMKSGFFPAWLQA